ncbi:MAG: exodeoxyribonuclease VII small subunit [Planctomycetota bacterium]|nr:MAG: exodeoxyribonuclease VII small subunit [Planctomycetota bacterium]
MAKKKTAEKSAQELNFEAALEELEEIVQRLESGEGPLDAALKDYARAVELIRRCNQVLSQTERQIEILSGVDAEGNPIVRPAEEGEFALEDAESAESSRRRRPARGES